MCVIFYFLLMKDTQKNANIKCTENSCKFKQTCKWNNRCMQEGLNLSTNSKKTAMQAVKLKQKPKK